jgi:hypothetical protein
MGSETQTRETCTRGALLNVTAWGSVKLLPVAFSRAVGLLGLPGVPAQPRTVVTDLPMSAGTDTTDKARGEPPEGHPAALQRPSQECLGGRSWPLLASHARIACALLPPTVAGLAPPIGPCRFTQQFLSPSNCRFEVKRLVPHKI